MSNQQNHFLDVFEAIVEKHGSNVAVLTDGDSPVTYAELKSKALAVARELTSQGAGAETVVGLQIEKSEDYLVSMLGCWYAGAAFMPLDPELPDERRDFILNDSKAEIILTRKSYSGRLPSDDKKIIYFEDFDFSAPLESIEPENNLSDLAYVIYTSGSTGTPKGVEVTHAGLVPMLEAQIDAFELNSDSRSLFYLSTNFDASISDIGTAFLSGASLCIETASPQDIAINLSKIIEDRSITYMDIPPSLLRILDPENIPQSLKSVTIGGEALDPQIARNWAGKVRLVNVYGPTEATVCTSLCIIDPENWNKPTVGDALPAVTYKVVNGDLKEVVAGESGELLIGGLQLARGYRGRDDLNETKFINIDGERYYRSGDSVTVGNNHELIFQGRIDRQVKINGQLVELEEVEAKILEIPSIAQAAVVKRNFKGSNALVAFIRSKGGLDIGALQNSLNLSLSPWMIPSHFEPVDAMPLTVTGKIDLTTLQSQTLSSTSKGLSEEFTETEQKLFQIWKSILKHDDFGIDDHFDDVGGDSLKVIDLSLSAEMQGMAITSNLVNGKKTIREIAAHLEAHRDVDADLDFVMSDAMKADDLRESMALDDEWNALVEQARKLPHPNDQAAPQNIFLTGANGFLASRLIYDLLSNSDAQIYALVRASSDEWGMDRIEQAIESHGLKLTDEMKQRITPVCGDLSKPFMGMDKGLWSSLSEQIDTVVHSGAIVNMTASYDALYGANVQGTKEAIKFALSGRRTKFHYASTLSVFVSTDQSHGDLLESDRLENTQTVYGGYGQTKWAAEYFLHQIPADVCDMSIHRLGLITGDSETGQSSSKDFLNMFVHGITKLGAVPNAKTNSIEVDVTPINYCSDVLRHIMLNNEHEQKEGHKVYHIANTAGFTLEQILNEIRWRGNQIDALPPCEWTKKMARMQSVGFSTEESAAYFGISRILPQDDTLRRHTAMDLFQATGVKFKQNNTQRMLKGSGITMPLPDNKLLSTYIDSITGQKKAISKRGVRKTMRGKTGLILGKFMPPHNGHFHLINFARNYPGVDKLYVVVDRTPDAPIPQSLRVNWIKEQFPDITVLPLGDYNYQDPSEAPNDKEFWDQWERSLKEAVPEGIDYCFNSEDYGWKLAEVLGATHVPVDRGRENFPISGTMMRDDPFSNWDQLPKVVRPYFTKKVAIVGAESTGKSTLAINLSKYFNTKVVPEYARLFLEALAEKKEPRSTDLGDIPIFADGQMASEQSLIGEANRVLICDTEPLTTKVWSDTLYSEVPASVEEHCDHANYDLYLVANPDVEWKPGVHRQWEDESKQERRLAFNSRIIDELNAAGKQFIEITGNDYEDRFVQAKDAIINHVFKGREFDDFSADLQ